MPKSRRLPFCFAPASDVLLCQVCTELENHVGVSDKTLAEFIISLAEENDGLPAFQRALEANGAEFPDSFTSTLHALILRLKPKKKAAAAAGPAAAKKAISTEKFPGLAIPDTAPVRFSPSPPKNRPSPPRDSRGGRDDRDRDRDRGRDRSRERDRSRDRGRDSRGGDRDGDRRRDRWEDDRSKPRVEAPRETEPQIYSVYRGRVANTMDFGVFITLEQFGRKEGLLHISQIQAKGRVLSGKDAFKRGKPPADPKHRISIPKSCTYVCTACRISNL